MIVCAVLVAAFVRLRQRQKLAQQMIPVDQRRAELKRAYRTQKNMAEELGISRMGAIRWQSGENVVVQVTIEVDGVAYPAMVPVDLALRIHPKRMRNVKWRARKGRGVETAFCGISKSILLIRGWP
jgi:hypothetical protein